VRWWRSRLPPARRWPGPAPCHSSHLPPSPFTSVKALSCSQCFGFGSAWIRTDFVLLDRDLGWQKWPIKIKKLKLHVWSAWCSLLRSEGFNCSLDVLYGVKIAIFYQNFNLSFLILVIKTLDLDPDPHPVPHWPKMLDPDCNQCGSETLVHTWGWGREVDVQAARY
jgi:hypothetical protein